MADSLSTLPVVRRLLLALLVLGLMGLGTELILLEHYEGLSQIIPLVLVAAALMAAIGQAWTGSAAMLRTLQVLMVLFVAAGGLGVLLHYQGNLEFQMDMDPTLSHWELFKKVMHAKAPPALAPGAMLQLGLLGLIFSFRHPALARAGSARVPDVPTGE